MKEKQVVKCENVNLSELREILPPFVARNWGDWSKFIPISSRTVANEDSRGTGPEGRFLIGNVIAYPKDALVDWLEKKSRVIE